MSTKIQVQGTNTKARKSTIQTDEDFNRQLEEKPKQVDEQVLTSLGEAMDQVRNALTTYKEAERNVATIYQKSEDQATLQYKKRGRKSQTSCDDSIREALKVRQESISVSYTHLTLPTSDLV